MYIFSLIEKITNELNLKKDIKDITIVDNIKFYLNKNKVIKIIKETNQENLTKEEKYIANLELSKYTLIDYILENNYKDNLLISLYFILGNAIFIDSNHFDSIVSEQQIFKLINDCIINNLSILINHSELYKFYNYFLIDSWIKTIIKKPIKKEDYYKISKLCKSDQDIRWKKYKYIWKKYNNTCLELRDYLYLIRDFYKDKKIKIVGCYSLGKNLYNLYNFYLESHLGLKVDIQKIEKWALKELDRLDRLMKDKLFIIDSTIDKTKSNVEIIKEIAKDQKYKSKEEFINHHKELIKKYEDIYLNRLNFKEYKNVNLIVFDDKDLAGGYYFDEVFYLNAANWNDTYKYTCESLILHETTPGHHLQVHPVKYVDQPNSLLYAYFGSIVNGFSEGWGLFSEKLGMNQTTWDQIGQIEYEIFRTLRIIVDIRIHYRGYKPKEMIKYMKKYLSLSNNEIESEVYRYVCLPGQAVSYKIGNHIFEIIIKNKGIKNLMDPKALEIYKELIHNGSMPLKFLLEKYNINQSELFN